MASFIAAGSAYATHGEPMIPVYVFYSMFGFQRTGDLMWAAATSSTAASCSARPRAVRRSTARACSTRTATRCCSRDQPGVVAYDPAFAYEIAVIVEDGAASGCTADEDVEDVFYYLTVYNEPKSSRRCRTRRRRRASSRASTAARRTGGDGNGEAPRAQLLASGTGIHWALDAQRLLAEDWGVAADVWSARRGPSCGARHWTATAQPLHPRRASGGCRS